MTILRKQSFDSQIADDNPIVCLSFSNVLERLALSRCSGPHRVANLSSTISKKWAADGDLTRWIDAMYAWPEGG